jgi:23S rRNA (guanosine2251-2'-O)-methyltransferase
MMENRKLKLQELNRLSTEEYTKTEKLPICIVLDNIRSLNNVGSAFRTSDALLVEKIYLAGITGTPPHRDIHKTALGAQDIVAWEHAPDMETLCKKLKNEGFELVSIEQTSNSIALQNFTFDKSKKYALIFGNEVDGVSDEAINLSDSCIEIPQFGTKHSFNVSVTMGIVLWDFLKNLKL